MTKSPKCLFPHFGKQWFMAICEHHGRRDRVLTTTWQQMRSGKTFILCVLKYKTEFFPKDTDPHYQMIGTMCTYRYVVTYEQLLTFMALVAYPFLKNTRRIFFQRTFHEFQDHIRLIEVGVEAAHFAHSHLKITKYIFDKKRSIWSASMKLEVFHCHKSRCSGRSNTHKNVKKGFAGKTNFVKQNRSRHPKFLTGLHQWAPSLCTSRMIRV